MTTWWARYRALSLGTKILIYMVVGVLAGIVVGERAQVVQPLGDLFIRLLLMAAIPLVFFNLLAGLTGLSDARVFGRIGARIMIFFVSTTVLAIALGLAVTTALHPGRGMELSATSAQAAGRVPGLSDILLDLIPDNIASAFAEGRVTQIVVFAVLLGLATLSLDPDPRAKLHRGFSLLADLFRALVNLVLYAGPIGIGALAASTVGRYGAELFGSLAYFIGGVITAQAIMVILYLLLVAGFSRLRPLEFLRQTAPLYATTAATCSSLASLVVSMELAERRLHIPREVYGLTLPLGSQLNKDGTAIMLVAVLLFTAQASGVTFEPGAYLTMIVVALILSQGSGGIPGGGLVMALIYVEAFGLPTEVAPVVGGIYRIIDMGNTTVNCMGDLVGTAIVAEMEPEGESS